MKFIIVGLGIFGASLAEKLTSKGNEVIGVDSRMDKVNALKDKITQTICMDATDQTAISNLPLKNSDIVIVCVGEDQGANIMITALFKNMNVKRLISRSINPLHENVLQAIGVNEIVRPEEETAERWAKKLCLRNVIDSFELNKDYSIVEVHVPKQFIGKTIEEIGFRKNHNLLILTIIKNTEVSNIIGKKRLIANVQGIPDPDTSFAEDDVLVVYGSNKDINTFIKANR
ncbi:MAG: TrkA family potassium uptake protein [Proteiniphilum sp.]|jgi:trk system potassium uptake protein TrkA|uniref:potassium channel family protein n=1 Tax=Proteiniphilum sp. TaxID=1926877 RepID=UPI000927C606|nr:TrkA family potassium uptake protein [Proteiniphilum sp.]MEA5128385.1 TrkA family potassium uptake protein [Proteiniphilum sp.]OJV82711.1 MAG: potassium transporter TrkA [Bacteroidia bacterium 44-10]